MQETIKFIKEQPIKFHLTICFIIFCIFFLGYANGWGAGLNRAYRSVEVTK